MSYTTENAANNIEAILPKTHEQELSLLNEAIALDGEGKGIVTNKEAWNKIYRQYNRFVFTIAKNVLHDDDEAEDVSQEIFLRLTEQFGSYNQTMPFRPWLASVVKNFCINHLKKKNSKPTRYIGVLSDEGFEEQAEATTYFKTADPNAQTSLEYAVAKERRKTIDDILNQMKPEFREVLELKYFEDKSYDEIANTINKPIGTVMSRLFNARKKMKVLYKQVTGLDMASFD